jgi:glucose-1-phosphate thymidylyltransferase
LADTTLLDHALDALTNADASRITVVGGTDAHALRQALATRADDRIHLVIQPEPLGQADAVLQAADGLRGPTLVLFVDTLHDIDLSTLALRCGSADGLLFARAMPDPSAFGVAVVDGSGLVQRLIEKPREPVSDRAVIGVYYLKDGEHLARSVRALVASGAQGATRGEFYLLDALQRMIDDGARFRLLPAQLWLDCGTPAALHEASRHVLRGQSHEVDPEAMGPGTVLRPPVRLAAGARVVGSVVGPFVAVAEGARIEDSVIGPDVGVGTGAQVRGACVSDSVLGAHSRIQSAVLSGSILAPGAMVMGRASRVVLGPDSFVGRAPAAENT